MDHHAPYFEMDDEVFGLQDSYYKPETGFEKSLMFDDDDDVAQFAWQDSQLCMQSQSQILPLNKQNDEAPLIIGEHTANQPSLQHEQKQLFMQEDETVSWLQCPLLENTSTFNQCFSDILYPLPSLGNSTTAPASTVHVSISEPRPQALRPPLPPKRPEFDPRVQNFGMFPIHKAKFEPGNSKKDVHTVVQPSDSTAGAEVETRNIEVDEGNCVLLGSEAAGILFVGGERAACKMMTTSSSTPVGSSAAAEHRQKPPAKVRKRKGRKGKDTKSINEDVGLDSADRKKHVCGSIHSKRSRAEVHNLLERKRREKINEKMRVLQELIPRCNKTDKVSLLDKAIEYLKSLQQQVKMMSMGYNMVPLMFPGVQQYMPPAGLGMGMNRPMLPFTNVVVGSTFPTPVAASHLTPRFPTPVFQMPTAPTLNSSGIQTTNFSDPTQRSFGEQNSIHPYVLPYSDPYHQYRGLTQMQLHLQQNMDAAHSYVQNHAKLLPSSK